MAIDYTRAATVAKALIDANGRPITFYQHNLTPGDADKPWRGPTNPLTTPTHTDVLNAVFVEPTSLERLGFSVKDHALFKKADQIMLVAPGVDYTGNLAEFQEVKDDDNEQWKILGAERLKPGTVTLLWFVMVCR